MLQELKDHNISKEKEDEIISRLESLAPQVNGIVVSDFVYGVVTQKILERLQDLSKKYNIILFGDVQCSSQVGSVLRFKILTYFALTKEKLELHFKIKIAALNK